MKWEKVRLGDVAKVSSSKRIFASQYTKSGVPFYRQKEIIDKKNKNEIINPLFISWETFDDIKKKFGAPNKNDLLITAVGATLGIPYVVIDEIFYFKDGNLIWLSNFDESINSKYLYYWINSDIGQKTIWSRTIGSAQPALTIDILKQLEIPVPIFNTQCKIVKILSAYDDLIESNQKQINLLEEAAQRLYKEWFVDFRFPGYEDVELENGLPKGWEYMKLERLANISTGECNREDAEEDGAYPLFDRSQEIKRSNVWLKDCEAIIVPGEGTSFIPRYYNGKFNLHQRCYCVEPLEKGMGFFLYQTLMMYRIYFLYVATGATVPSLRLNNFNNFKVLLPKKELCFQYNEIAEKMNDEILLLKNKNELLAKQRDMLLPRLMSGKLEV